ncbi:Sec20 domain-containingprotein [Purpureocillium lavendulum]|uniref:Sec20 domain-containingprotein n=1 Tax=Purpureocillium lavendulum TaxID=1247861 RepID=A0AB34G4I9_9HYPO|nr:Sec20 domain-containingprotein [Purpureocillium lavendulum]
MSLEGLQERLTALQETTSQLRDLIDRLANLKYQPGAVPLGTNEEDSPSGELSAEIGQLLRGGLEEQELLREEAKFARPEGHDKLRLTEGVERLGGELASYRGAFRKARLAAKRSLEQAQRHERELLIQSFSVPVSEAASPTGTPSSDDAVVAAAAAHTRSALRHSHHHHQQHQKSSLSEQDQQTVGASSNVTEALRRTHDLIAAELSRSEFAHQTLEESSAALRQLGESYASLEGMLARSRDLLGALLRSQKSDTWYLQTSLYMLLVTGAWLVFRRLLYGPAWWLVWLPLRVLFGVGSRAGGAVLRAGGPGAGESGGVHQAGRDGREAPPVEGLPDEDLPTVKVGRDDAQAGKQDGKGADPDSMVDQVGKIIDAANEADELGSLPDEPEHERNTKKRMWEEKETPAPGDDTRARDEL